MIWKWNLNVESILILSWLNFSLSDCYISTLLGIREEGELGPFNTSILSHFFVLISKLNCPSCIYFYFLYKNPSSLVKQHGIELRMWILEPDLLGPNLDSITYQICGFANTSTMPLGCIAYLFLFWNDMWDPIGTGDLPAHPRASLQSINVINVM